MGMCAVVCSRTLFKNWARTVLKVFKNSSSILRNVKLDKFVRTDILEMSLKTILEQFKNPESS